MSMHKVEVEQIVKPIRDSKGTIQVGASRDKFFGQSLVEKDKHGTGSITVSFGAMKSQHLAQELYETRIASMQRFIAMTVMFHQVRLVSLIYVCILMCSV